MADEMESSGESEEARPGEPSESSEPADRNPWRRSQAAATLLALALILLAAGVAGALRSASGLGIQNLQLAGSADKALEFFGDDLASRMAAEVREAIAADGRVIFAYVAAVCVAASFGFSLFVSRRARRLAGAAIPAVVLAGLCDALENAALINGMDRLAGAGPPGDADLAFRVAAIAATFKFCLLALVLPVAAVATATVLKRSFAHTFSRTAIAGRAPDLLLPWRTINSRGVPWPAESSSMAAKLEESAEDRRTARHLYGRLVPPGRAPKPPLRPDCEVGFCVSGGGIRSACFTLGILQELRRELLRARYLVSVSGGGYLAGALQLALTEQPPPGAAGAERAPISPGDAYGEGSMEEDHIRRHGDYLADGAGQWLVALWTVLRGVLASFVVISTTVASIGLALSWFYDLAPLIDRASLAAAFDAPGGGPPAYPAPLVPVQAVFPYLLGAAGLAWIASVRLLFTRPGAARSLQLLAGTLLAALAVVVLFVYAIPALMWLVTFPAAQAIETGEDLGTAGRVGAGAGGTLFFTYLGALVAIIGRGGRVAGGLWERVRGLFGGRGDAGGSPRGPAGLVQRLAVWAVLLVILASNLLVLGVSAAGGADWEPWLQIGVPATLVLIWWAVDQTWMSLHPFYRKRLASAFSVRRVRLPGGDIAARPYHFEAEDTPLAYYGRPVPGFPQVIFACAANLSGPDRTAPGRRAVSYTLSHDYIGGADVGWIPTELAQQALSGPVRADLTVQAAMAISGAAFASAMGTQSQAYQRILALSNARLGSWLPNPVYFHALARRDPAWWLPDFPRIRRLTYFYREIFGSHPEDNRLLLLTDGGHYDNLGLIELLRHRCRTIYCIDSGGDPPPFPQSLSEAITQARAELGVRVEFDQEDINALLVGSGKMPDFPDAIEPILPRLSAKAVAVGRIRYPEPFRLDCEAEASDEGTIVFAKSLITPGMPAELFAYAASKPVFPRDPTGDQWFTGAQFNAYQALGRDVGRQVLQESGDRGRALAREPGPQV